jgi:hypothetical protein
LKGRAPPLHWYPAICIIQTRSRNNSWKERVQSNRRRK